MRYFKPIAFCFLTSFCAGMFIGCSAFDRYDKNPEGYYEEHFRSCGPEALEKAFQALKQKVGRKEISKIVQEQPRPFIQLLSFFDKDAVEITWPSDVKRVAKKYGFKIVPIKDYDKLNPKKDVALILINTKLNNYHWLCFPVDKNIPKYWGEKTRVSKIYILKKI